uniref:Uncharacterized protein n=1 Tax=Timema shepardi TaxID=629360 RepID=A0A7R9B6X1_TIMSH|nr:unnamed protein product [Timema shepardi]
MKYQDMLIMTPLGICSEHPDLTLLGATRGLPWRWGTRSRGRKDDQAWSQPRRLALWVSSKVTDVSCWRSDIIGITSSNISSFHPGYTYSPSESYYRPEAPGLYREFIDQPSR